MQVEARMTPANLHDKDVLIAAFLARIEQRVARVAELAGAATQNAG